MAFTGLPAVTQTTCPPSRNRIRRERLRRTVPLADSQRSHRGEAVVVGLRSKVTGTDRTEFSCSARRSAIPSCSATPRARS